MIWILVVILLIIIIVSASKSNKKKKLEIEELKYKKQEREAAENKVASNENASVADEISKLKVLLRDGDLTQEEFENQKAKLLS